MRVAVGRHVAARYTDGVEVHREVALAVDGEQAADAAGHLGPGVKNLVGDSLAAISL